jgi:hypothetical protein
MGSRKRRAAVVVVPVLLGICALAVYAAVAQPGGVGPSSASSPTPRPTISSQQAIDIATRTSAANGEVSAVASPGYDERLGSWVWRVRWAYSAGPTSGEFCDVWVDLYTGEILDRQCVYS